ncbi:MAG: chemotaxis response regulator protein-glutamate methylesterase [Candidatus Riflebacteria bacterium]|nr:chemotaxis response regulator protein-glutamate methylesterase [Candidatus Riflebacteria bacterium]
MSLRVLVVEDSAVFRRVIQDALRKIPGIEIIGTAGTGHLALSKIREAKPDLVTLDIELPDMTGLQVLDELRQYNLLPGVIVVSALTSRGGKLSMSAIEKGAMDFITKPEGGNFEENCQALFTSLEPLVRGFIRRQEIRSILRAKPSGASEQSSILPKSSAQEPSHLDNVAERMRRLENSQKPQMVLIGVSTGGPVALGELLPMLPGDLQVPIFIVQHIPPLFTKPLVERLQLKCRMKVKEAENGEFAQPNVAYISPGGVHLRLSKNANSRIILQLTDEPPENNCRPSVDVLFRSAAHLFPGQGMPIILTGMGSDGTIGLRLLKRHPCWSIAQDEATCAVFGMPKAAIESGIIDQVLPLQDIASAIVSRIRLAFPRPQGTRI